MMAAWTGGRARDSDKEWNLGRGLRQADLAYGMNMEDERKGRSWMTPEVEGSVIE